MCEPSSSEIETEQQQRQPQTDNESAIEVEEADFGKLASAVGEEPPEFRDSHGDDEPSRWTKTCRSLKQFYFDNEFLILVIVAILVARAYPPLGADYLQPDITATWIAVIFIFVLAGLGLKTSEFSKAFQRLYFNAFVQCFNFGVVSAIVYGFSRAMEAAGAISQNLADGMVICSCLPLTINMCMVLTKAAGGDEAAAIFNSAFGNLVGVFLSPLLILGYIGVTGDVDLLEVFYKLALRVVLPILVGQILQKTSKTVVSFVQKNKKWFKKAQMYTLVFIVYTVFCKTFEGDTVSSVGEIFVMIAFQFLLLCLVMTLSWYSLKLVFPNEPRLRVMGLFGCTHKTVAMGVPLINAIYEGNANVGVYTLPLLIWHPMQLVIGSALTPRLSAFVEREKQRLGIEDDAAGDDLALPVVEEAPDETNEATSVEEEGVAEPNDEEAP